jgi:hypothetical protein
MAIAPISREEEGRFSNLRLGKENLDGGIADHSGLCAAFRVGETDGAFLVIQPSPLKS